MLKRIIKTSFFSVGSRGFLTLTNLVIVLSISRQFGDETLGIYSISAFFYYLFSFFTSFELTTYFGKEIAHRRDRLEDLKRLFGEIGTTFIIGGTLSVFTLIVLLLSYYPISAHLMVISAVSGIIFGIEKNLSGVLLGKEKMQFEFISQLVAAVIVAIPAFFFIKQLGIAGVYYLRIGASFVTIILRVIFTRAAEYFDLKQISLEKYNWKEIRYFSLSGCSFFIQHHIDLFILSFLIPIGLQGAYFLALRIFLAFTLLAEMLSFALTPYLSRTYRGDDPDGFNRFYSKMFRLQLGIGAVASVVFYFSRHLLVSLFTKSDSNPELTAQFLLYFSFFMFFRFVSYYTGNVLTSTRFQNVRFYILITSSVLLILLEIVLGKLFSVYGIIYARAVMEVFIFIAYLAAVAKIRAKPVQANV